MLFEHKDFLGFTLKEGDHVVSMVVGYRELVRCEIVKITPQKVRLKPICATRGRTAAWDSNDDEFLQFPNQVVLIRP